MLQQSNITPNIRTGAGYNPGFVATETAFSLQLPPNVTYLETGLAEYERLSTALRHLSVEISLHLARTPITEPDRAQDTFVAYLAEKFGQLHDDNISPPVSIGLHLTGERDSGIGKLGFSAHYEASCAAERRAIRFVERMQRELGTPVWIENANFYSHSGTDVLRAWRSTEHICREAGARLIVDLSHLLVDTHNLGMAPEIFLGAIPWDLVSELHLSGVIEARDGSFHDGHSECVHPLVWRLLLPCMNDLIDDKHTLMITIEHTDPLWVQRQAEFSLDFERLAAIINERNRRGGRAELAMSYASSYLTKLLQRWLPDVKRDCIARQMRFETLVQEWIETTTAAEHQRIVLTLEELPPCERSQVQVAARSFLAFARGRLGSCE